MNVNVRFGVSVPEGLDETDIKKSLEDWLDAVAKVAPAPKDCEVLGHRLLSVTRRAR